MYIFIYYQIANNFNSYLIDNVARKCAMMLKGKVVSLVTDSQHLHQVDRVERILTKNEITVKIGKGN